MNANAGGALKATKGQRDPLELYCGNGNFSLALARNFERVRQRKLPNRPCGRAVQHCRQPYRQRADYSYGRRVYAGHERRARINCLEGIDSKGYQCETIFVDPPRSGLDSETEKMVQAYLRILYISCNPKRCAKTRNIARRTRLNVWRCSISSRIRTIWSAVFYLAHGDL